MALTFGDNIHTKTFTPQEYLVEVLSSAKNKNVIISLGGLTNKVFVILNLIRELAFKIHRKYEKRKWTLLILEETEIDQYMFSIRHLTDLKPLLIKSVNDLDLINYEVIVTTENQCLEMFEKKYLDFDQLNLVIFNNCQKITVINSTYFKVCNFIKANSKCRILGIVHPLFELDSDPFFIEDQLKFISNKLFSSIETASDIVSILRHCCKPKEVFIECAVQTEYVINSTIKSMVQSLTEFLNDHNYEPAIIYSDDEEYGEELKQISHPKNEPLQMIADFLDVLKTMGPYCADKAALTLLYMVEKLKVKTKYERHYILLCIVSTLLIQIRATFDDIFYNYSNIDKILKFSSPRVLRIIDTLKQFKPKSFKPDNNNVEVCNDQKDKKDRTTKSKSVRRNWKLARRYGTHRKQGRSRDQYEETVCAIVLVKNKMTASILYYLFLDLKNSNKDDFGWIQPQYTVDKEADPIAEPKEFEIEHKKQEETLRRFRQRECNVLIGTKVLEAGIDLPRCNLVVNYNIPLSYKSYLRTKSRAKTLDAHYVLMFDENVTSNILSCFKLYKDINKMLLSHCTLKDINMEKEIYADRYNWCVTPFKPGKKEDSAFVDMASAIGLVNRYCAKLPSDTFTKLSPIWKIQSVIYENKPMFVCSIRLPINSPIKHDIHGHPMPCEILAKRIAALEVCRQLHSQGELDDTLQPITKESFHALFNADEVLADAEDSLIPWDTEEPRPGTNKRRQYYYKRIAEALNDCRPVEGKPCYLYAILLNMNCPVPEEQNTRGRRIHPPEESIHGFGILTTKLIPSIPSFPIYTRCGEVYVSLKPIKTNMLLTHHQLDNIAIFLNYTFTNVLRLQKCHVAFDPTTTHNCYYIVPTLRDASGLIDIDWNFLDNMHKCKDNKLSIITNEDRINFQPDIEVLKDAVVTPWYRNQEQPQYFYVAEICTHLNPKSPFPGSIENYKTFEDYYNLKYNLKIQNLEQPLLDVDHTSARLNFLTPRYMNRKGVILPTSSDATKRAKRDNLSQKQILVPELCNVHLFPASMWRKAVSLPCILYRINALLLADEIRTIVAKDISLGLLNLSFDHIWEPLDFGWTMKDVLIKRKEQKENSVIQIVEPVEIVKQIVVEEINEEKIDKSDDPNWMDIGTWSNDMADFAMYNNDNTTKVRYSSPTSWMVQSDNESSTFSDIDSDDEIQVDGLNSNGLRIEFKNTYLAEAVDANDSKTNKLFFFKNNETSHSWIWNDNCHSVANYNSDQIDKQIINLFYKKDDEIIINREVKSSTNIDSSSLLKLPWELNSDTGYGLPDINILSNNTSFVPKDEKCIKNEIHINKKTIDNINKVHDIQNETFSFDFQPDLDNHPGPSPSVILQALTMSNANDGINLERLETIGDSFLKYAITAYLYCTHDNVHEGKLSHLRSKQVSNLNLYRLGKLKMFGERMISTKFEPHDNWLPPCYFVPHKLEKALINASIPTSLWNMITLPTFKDPTDKEIEEVIQQFKVGFSNEDLESTPLFVPYNLVTQHSIPDKSIADCVEALIGAYLISCGARGALLFMSWLGIKVLPSLDCSKLGYLKPPSSPLLRNVHNPEGELTKLMDGFESFEQHLGYHFQDRSYLLQAMTHASYYPNRLTDCYQRLEFLGDAVLDYLITRHLYEDKRQHSPGALTDLRSALVNNTIFASLAVRNGFHKYFKHLSPGLSEVICKFVTIQEENGHTIDEEFYFLGEDDCEEAEDVEVPKALGDVFESVAGAIYLDSNMSLDTVWKVYHKIMENEMEQFSKNVPKSPIRELLELEPETAKFSKPEKLADGRRVRVIVEIFGKGEFKGIGRNYRIAKCTAAKCALKHLKKKIKK
ncbi:endoribonuclease Dcr-1 [Aphis gossypii]|uniref:endoribonuclease Dcr-1 n=1 Tax=Aphis gossypii TaxID=80765 RepID=UPI0021591218|nr:endoribonuclease Dcr-1 [Aphis gossypii]XP_050060174.1 endoribonuclease Dcr-1 [Aphis gossypii]XP_050060175.1 endoribonuclease Dcr-1 [Aphis gossypii]XP_050060176.1 endoribonuclease Dcr-1 [Aphis gossypii]XP_050060177.1 endoribonuclease Dcr-1 [Aphis gossypii]